MKLAHVVPSLEERHGGPSKSVRALANALAAQGDVVELCATAVAGDRAAPRADDRAEVRIFPRLSPEWIVRSPALARQLRDGAFDCIHHHALWLRTLHHAAQAAKRQPCPLVISPRGMMNSWAWQHRRWRKRLAAWFIHPGAFAQAAGWHATSQEEAQAIRDLGFKQPICVAPNGVELPADPALAAARQHWLGVCPMAQTRPVALYYSRLHRKKRVRELMELWLSAPRGDWLLLVVGSPEEYSAEQLASEVAARGAGDRIAVFNGEGQPPPYAIGSLFLLPSHSENFGLVIAEALAAGVPALVTDTTPWRGLARERAGWCVPWEQYPVALDRALVLSPEVLRSLGRNGRNWMQRDYSWEQAARLLHHFYRGLADARK